MNEDLKMNKDTYPVSHNAPAAIPRKNDLLREVATILREDGHVYIQEIETNYEPDLADAMDKIWKGELEL